MIRKLSLQEGRGRNPYENLGMEEYLLYHTEPEECILYLWQNEKTVVIGRNQNAWKECRTEELEADGGHLARRLSGGGAVFHDLGNLNFTFLTRKCNYDIARQTEVILDAVQSLGIPAVRTGRNDITADGRKFSGSAYYETGDYCYHHGTVLLSADTAAMEKYLMVSKEKMESKGVSSVRSRVGNLCRYLPGLTVEELEKQLKESFQKVYGLSAFPLLAERLEEEEIARRGKNFASWEWRYGRKIPFTDSAFRRFSWGEAELLIKVDRGRIEDIRLSTDALDTRLPGLMEQVLRGSAWNRRAVAERLGTITCDTKAQQEMAEEIGEMVLSMLL